MAKTAKKSPSRVVSGSTKKSKGSFKLSRKGMLIGLVAVVAFSVAGGIGWQQWQDSQRTAGAFNWQYVGGNGGFSMRACRTSSNTGYYYVLNPTGASLTSKYGGAVRFRVNPNSNSGIYFAQGRTEVLTASSVASASWYPNFAYLVAC